MNFCKSKRNLKNKPDASAAGEFIYCKVSFMQLELNTDLYKGILFQPLLAMMCRQYLTKSNLKSLLKSNLM